MTLGTLIIIVGVISFLAIRSSFNVFKFIAGLLWLGLDIYWYGGGQPAGITAGTPADLFFMLGMLVFAVGFMLYAFRSENGQGRMFRISLGRLMGNADQMTPSGREARRERNAAYRDRVNRALGR